jgi:hypothetical protein
MIQENSENSGNQTFHRLECHIFWTEKFEEFLSKMGHPNAHSGQIGYIKPRWNRGIGYSHIDAIICIILSYPPQRWVIVVK